MTPLGQKYAGPWNSCDICTEKKQKHIQFLKGQPFDPERNDALWEKHTTSSQH